jgi:transcriptional regulator with XRE-family HTH domain
MSESTELSQLTIAKVLQGLLASKRLTVSELARRIEVPQPTLYRITTGHHLRPQQKTLQRIASFFEVSVDQLCGREIIPGFVAGGGQQQRVPLVNIAQIEAGQLNSQHYISVDIPVSEASFALKMPDASMEPMVSKDAILIVDPQKVPAYRSFALIYLASCQEIVVRQMLKDAGKFYLRALSEDLQKIGLSLLEAQDRVLGIIVEIRIQLEDE